MKLSRLFCRPVIAALAFGMASATLMEAVRAQAFPNRPVRLIVPYPAGGPIDVFARALGVRLTETWGQTVVVENRSGANEMIAAEHVVKSPADGYTMLVASEASFSLNQFLYSKIPYDPVKDLAPITRAISVSFAIAVGNHVPANTLAELLDLARKNPGKVTYGSGGIGGAQHLAAAWLASIAKVDMHHVPYKGLAPAVQDIMGGQIDSVFGALSVIQPLVASGKLRAFAVAGAKRAKSLPQVPTFAEAGIKDYDVGFYIGIAGPARIPAPIIEKISADMRTVVRSAEFREKNVDPYAMDVVAETPAEFAAFLVKDREHQARLVKISGAKLD